MPTSLEIVNVMELGVFTFMTEKLRVDIELFLKTETEESLLKLLKDKTMLGCLVSLSTLNSKGKQIEEKQYVP